MEAETRGPHAEVVVDDCADDSTRGRLVVALVDAFRRMTTSLLGHVASTGSSHVACDWFLVRRVLTSKEGLVWLGLQFRDKQFVESVKLVG